MNLSLKSSLLKFAAALALAAGFASAQAEAVPKVIRIGVASPAVGDDVYTTGSVGIAHHKKLIEEEFAKEGVKVEWYFYKGAGPAVNEALSNNQLDFAFQGDLPSIIGRASGLKTRYLFPTDSRQNLYVAVPPDSPIKSVKELAGKRVALSKGTNAQLLAQVPSLGWLPLLMMIVGIEESLKIILIAKAVAVPITINTYQGIQGVPTRFIEVARVYGFTRWQLLRKVVLPAAFPPIWNGIRYGMTHAWLALVAVELLASSEGLGFMIVYGRQLFQLDVVIAAVIVVGAVGYTIDKVLAIIEGRLLHWRRQSF